MSSQASAGLRRIAPVALAAVILSAPASAATAGCAPAGARVLRRSALASIYSRGEVLYGCANSTRTLLGTLHGTHLFPATRVARYVLAGGYAGIDTAQMGVDNFASKLTIYDLRTGASQSARATTFTPRAESFDTASSLRVDSDGVLAWVGRQSSVGAFAPRYELRAIDLSERSTMWGTLPAKPTQLTLHGHTLTWRIAAQAPRHTTV